MATGRRPRVVIIGSGFGGLFAAKALAKHDVEVILVAKTTHHLFQPLLYQVATGILAPGEIAPQNRDVLKKAKNVRVLLSEVTAIDLPTKKLRAEALGVVSHIRFDYLIVAAGAGQSYFGKDEFNVFAPGMKSIDDALELRARIYGSLEMAELTLDPVEKKRLTTFVVVGAGPTGVEMAGQIRELTSHTMKRDFRTFNPKDSTVILFDGADKVLAPFGETLAGKAKKTLEKIGIDVRLNAMVTDLDGDGLTVKYKDGHTETIAAGCKVWAAGVQASELGKTLAEQSGAELDRAGRVIVNRDCTLPNYPNVFVVGDMMNFDNLPAVAQVAIQTARYSVKKIVADINNQPFTKEFSYFDKGSMAVISRFKAVVKMGKMEMTGFFAWAAWLFLHIIYVTGFKNQISTLLHWFIAFFSHSRSERTSTRQQLAGRLALKQLGKDFQPTITGTLKPTAIDPRIKAEMDRDVRPQEI